MVFTSKNLHAKRRNMSFIKGATIFFLWMSCILFMANAFEIWVVAPNAFQYIQKIFLTNSGDNTSATGIILDGTTAGGITITNLTGIRVLGTDSNGKLIAQTSGIVYNLISWFVLSLTWPAWVAWPTWPAWSAWTAWATWPTWPAWTAWIAWIAWATGYSVVMKTVQIASGATSGQCAWTGNLISFYADVGYNWWDIWDPYLIGLIICADGAQWPAWPTWPTWPQWPAWADGTNWATWPTWPQWPIGNTWPTGFLQAWIAGASPYYNWSAWVTTNNTAIYNNGGNIGIGTNTPTAKLTVTAGWRFDFTPGDARSDIYMNTTYLPWGFKIGYWSAYGPARGVIWSQGNGLLLSTSSLSLASTPREDVFIDGKGWVGIWTVTPTTNLDVNGEWKFLNNIQIGAEVNNATRCTDSSDAGKIAYEIRCVSGRDRSVFMWCMQSWSLSVVVEKVMVVGWMVGLGCTSVEVTP